MKAAATAARAPRVPVLAASGWMAGALNAPLWRELHALGLLRQPAGWGLALALATTIMAVLVALLSLAAWRHTLKPVAALLLLSAASGAYFMLAYGVVIDAGMMANVLQTDRQEAAALLSPWLLLFLAGFGLVPAWLLWRLPLHFGSPGRQALRNLAAAAGALFAAVLAVLLAFQPLASAMRNHKHLRYLMNPLNAVYAVGQVAAQPLRRPARLAPAGRDAQAPPPGARTPLLVLVLGETARADHFTLNGYARDTTPRLAREDVASWRNAWSCGTSTAASLPCMFSHLGRAGFDERENDYENLLDVLQHAGLAVLWLDNQGGCKGVCDRVPHASTGDSPVPGLCDGAECLDGALLEGLGARLQALPPERRARGIVLVLHQMGSHGPAYARRSPADAKLFLPECTGVNLQDCGAEALRNAYDNSIAYTDAVLADTIAWLRRMEAAGHDGALLYVSDHGESLGEGNLYLHGMPYAIAPDGQKHVPWISWLGQGFQRRSGIAMDCLRARAEQPVSHDHLFHSVLGLMQVRTALYRRAMDAYADCAAH